MLPSLETSERFKKEFDDFKLRISKVTNESLKKELNEKLFQLLREVRNIDDQHKDLLSTGQLPTSLIPETRDRLSEVRKYIARRLEDYEKSIA
jgi:hypothetical protein